jgi:hypothetical protein
VVNILTRGDKNNLRNTGGLRFQREAPEEVIILRALISTARSDLREALAEVSTTPQSATKKPRTANILLAKRTAGEEIVKAAQHVRG